MKDINKIIDSLSPGEQNVMYNALRVKLDKKPEYTISKDEHGYYVSSDKRMFGTFRFEKKELFDTLAKRGKAWDSEKKQIVDLKPKCEFKPFDKVVVRCGKADKWSIDFFSYKVSNGYICTGDAWFGYCLPYNEETAKLVGTTNNVGG